MQTRVRTRLRRYYFSPLPSVHVPQGTASALPQVRFRLQVAAIVRTGLQRASVVAPGQAGLCFSVRVIIVPRLLSGWLSRLVSCLNYRHQPVFVATSTTLTLTSRLATPCRGAAAGRPCRLRAASEPLQPGLCYR